MSLTLLRHCQSESNARGEFCGRNDALLTDAGRDVACNLNLGADIVFTSPLKRAAETARIVACDAPVHEVAELIERDWGGLSGLTYDEACDNYGRKTVMRACKTRHVRAPDGGESEDDIVLRLSTFLMRHVLWRVHGGAQHVCIVSHSHTLKAICRILRVTNRKQRPGEFVTFAKEELIDQSL